MSVHLYLKLTGIYLYKNLLSAKLIWQTPRNSFISVENSTDSLSSWTVERRETFTYPSSDHRGSSQSTGPDLFSHRGFPKQAGRYNLSTVSWVCPGVSPRLDLSNLPPTGGAVGPSWPDAWTVSCGSSHCGGEAGRVRLQRKLISTTVLFFRSLSTALDHMSEYVQLDYSVNSVLPFDSALC